MWKWTREVESVMFVLHNKKISTKWLDLAKSFYHTWQPNFHITSETVPFWFCVQCFHGHTLVYFLWMLWFSLTENGCSSLCLSPATLMEKQYRLGMDRNFSIINKMEYYSLHIQLVVYNIFSCSNLGLSLAALGVWHMTHV